MECWGASGSNGSVTDGTVEGGKGGYSKGNSSLSANVTVYICVGGEGIGTGSSKNTKNEGRNAANSGGYNGGGNSTAWGNTSSGSGGGATHIATKTGLLSSFSSSKSNVLIVAGGGGGSASNVGTAIGHTPGNASGGSGGGNNGGRGNNPPNNDGAYGEGGTQTSAGLSILCPFNTSRTIGQSGNFGLGGSGSDSDGGAGGGAGWYGGGGASVWGGAGGGSGYIGGVANGFMQNGVQSGNGKAVISWHPAI